MDAPPNNPKLHFQKLSRRASVFLLLRETQIRAVISKKKLHLRFVHANNHQHRRHTQRRCAACSSQLTVGLDAAASANRPNAFSMDWFVNPSARGKPSAIASTSLPPPLMTLLLRASNLSTPIAIDGTRVWLIAVLTEEARQQTKIKERKIRGGRDW